MRVVGLPADRSGIFFTSRTTYLLGVIPTGSAGKVCLRNPSGRFRGIVNTGPGGFAQMSLDVTPLPIQGVHYPAIAGMTWYFQFWHRDTEAGLPTSNVSNAAGIPFQ